jgi:predicted ATPase
LHPRLQAELAELIVQSASTRGNQFILETHSEHLLLRIRRLIRRGTIPAELVSILYVDPRIDGTADVIEIDLGDDGEFLDEWPDGFFPERFNELFGD